MTPCLGINTGILGVLEGVKNHVGEVLKFEFYKVPSSL